MAFTLEIIVYSLSHLGRDLPFLPLHGLLFSLIHVNHLFHMLVVGSMKACIVSAPWSVVHLASYDFLLFSYVFLEPFTLHQHVLYSVFHIQMYLFQHFISVLTYQTQIKQILNPPRYNVWPWNTDNATDHKSLPLKYMALLLHIWLRTF